MSDIEATNMEGAVSLVPGVVTEPVSDSVVGQELAAVPSSQGDVQIAGNEDRVGEREDILALESKIGRLSLTDRAQVAAMVEHFLESRESKDDSAAKQQGAIPKSRPRSQPQRKEFVGVSSVSGSRISSRVDSDSLDVDSSVGTRTEDSSVASRNSRSRSRRKLVSRAVKTEAADVSRDSLGSSSGTVVGRSGRRVGSRRRKKDSDRSSKSRQSNDGKKIPNMEDFEADSGMSLRTYLKKFEEHCRENVRGASGYWIAELEPKLKGEVLKAFKTLKSADDTWDSLKVKLLDWYKTDRQARRNRFKDKFSKAAREDKEGMFMLAMRLEKMFVIAYPYNEAENSKTLREKLMEIAPSRFRVMLENHIVRRKESNKPVSWTRIKRLASIHDSEKFEKSEKSETIVINVAERDEVVPSPSMSNRASESNFVDPPVGSIGRTAGLGRAGRTPFAHTQNRQFGRQNRSASSLGRNRQFQERGDYNLQSRSPRNRNLSSCDFCGKLGHFRRDCWFRRGACLACGEIGHFIAGCHRNNVDRTRYNSRQGRAVSLEGDRYGDSGDTRQESSVTGNDQQFQEN